MNNPNFYHLGDTSINVVKTHDWRWVYLHGEAEILHAQIAERNLWEWHAPDLFWSDQPRPSDPGVYPASLYGHEVIVVLAFRSLDWLTGRAVLATDMVALPHALRPADWR